MTVQQARRQFVCLAEAAQAEAREKLAQAWRGIESGNGDEALLDLLVSYAMSAVENAYRYQLNVTV